MSFIKCIFSPSHLEKRILVLIPLVCVMCMVIHFSERLHYNQNIGGLVNLSDRWPTAGVTIRETLNDSQFSTKEETKDYIKKCRSLLTQNRAVLVDNKERWPISREVIRDTLNYSQLATKEQVKEYIEKSRSLTIKPRNIRLITTSLSPCWRIEAGRISCLPYFHFAGFDKCGTTDLHAQITKHPQILFNYPFKEINWWTIFRFQNRTARYKYDIQPDMTFYLSTIKRYGQPLIYEGYGMSTQVQLITSDNSLDLAWKQKVVPGMAEDQDEKDPFSNNLLQAIRDFRLLNIQVVHEYTPNAKYIIMMREPVSRLWSDYLFSKFLEINYNWNTATRISQQDFHEGVLKYLQTMRECLQTRDVRYCAYYANSWPESATAKDMRLNSNIRIHMGLYVIFINDVLRVVPRENVLLINYHQYIKNKTTIMEQVFNFLGVDHKVYNLSEVDQKSKENARNKAVDIGEMWTNTSEILQKFYKPFNEELAKFTGDNSYLFDDVMEPATTTSSILT